MIQEQQDSADAAPEFSVVVSCYFEEKSIEEFHARLSAALGALGRSYEIILVNDGSTDGTWKRLNGIFEKDPKVAAVLDLFKNAGQQAAVTAGLEEARGQAFVLIDSDLQLAPEELPRLVAKYDEGYDLVSGYRENRKDPLSRVVPSRIANMIMRKASKSDLRDFGCTFKIYRGDFIRAFDFGPYHIFSNVDAIAETRRYAEVPVTHYPRKYGASGWTFGKLWKYNMDNVVKLSSRAFRIVAALFLLTGLAVLLRVLLNFVFPVSFFDDISPGLLLNAIVVSFLLVLAILSVLGEFTIRCFIRLQEVPGYIVREKRDRLDSSTGWP